jgi:rsbT co-antagonist protein RsbR
MPALAIPARLRITQRQAALALFALLITFTVTFGVIGVLRGDARIIIACLGSLPIHVLLLTLYMRGWLPAPYLVVILITLLVSFLVDGTIVELWPLLPVVLALVFTDARWTAGIGLAVMFVILARSGWAGPYASPDALLTYVLLILCLVASRLIVETALDEATTQAKVAEGARREATEALVLAEERATALSAQGATQAELLTELQQQQAELQQQREVILALSVPVMPLGNNTIVIPLVGALDSARLHGLMRQALASVENHRARVLLLDVTGVLTIDHQVAQGLLGVAQSARLLGAQVALVGVRPEVAQTIVAQGLQLDGIRSFISLDEGVRALAQRN